MEHSVYGAQAANVVLDSEGKLVADHVFHGFDETVKQQIREYLHPPAKEPKPEKLNWQKAYENGEHLRSAEITEEQNYNMIDGRMNNLPLKPWKIGNRISVLDRLHLKQRKLPDGAGKLCRRWRRKKKWSGEGNKKEEDALSGGQASSFFLVSEIL